MNLLDITCKSFLSLFALMRLTQINTTDPISLLIFAVFIYIYRKLSSSSLKTRMKDADPWCAGILAALFTLFTIGSHRFHALWRYGQHSLPAHYTDIVCRRTWTDLLPCRSVPADLCLAAQN